MVEVIELPPQPNLPTLSARHVVKTLGEHREAFLNANNLTGFRFDDEYILRKDRIADLLLMVSCTKGLHWQQIKDFGRDIQKLVKGAAADLILAECLNLVAKALGYNRASLARACRDEGGFVENLWGYGILINESMFDHIGKIKGDKGAYERVYKNRHRNMEESKTLNRMRHSANAATRVHAKEHKRQERQRHRSMPIEFR